MAKSFDKVRFGVVAPANIPIHRQEVYEAIQREQDILRIADGGSR